MNTLKSALLTSLVATGSLLQADTITTAAGDILHGTIVGIQGGNITLETDFAGTLTIPREKVAKLD